MALTGKPLFDLDEEKRLQDYEPTLEEFKECKEDYFWYAVYDDNEIGMKAWAPAIGVKSPDNIDRDRVKMVVLVPNPVLGRDRIVFYIDQKAGEKLVLFMSRDIQLMGGNPGERSSHYTVGWEMPTADGKITIYCQISGKGRKIYVSSERKI